jgi:hypothetical protein
MSDSIINQLIASGSLPRAIAMIDGGGVITRMADIKAEFDEGICGPIPSRMGAFGTGGLKQPPRGIAFVVQEGGIVPSGGDEIRENKIRRFTGGPAPFVQSKVLHLIAEDLSFSTNDESPITIDWADSSTNNSKLAAPDVDASPNYKKNILNGFSTIEFDDERAYFEMSSPPESLQTLKNKSLYLVLKYTTSEMDDSSDVNDFGDVDSHSLAVSASSTANNIIKDKFCAYAINVDTNVSFFRATSNDLGSFTTNLISSEDDQGDDFAIVPVTDGEFIASPEVAEIIIYDSAHNATQNGKVLKYLFCKYALISTDQV